MKRQGRAAQLLIASESSKQSSLANCPWQCLEISFVGFRVNVAQPGEQASGVNLSVLVNYKIYQRKHLERLP